MDGCEPRMTPAPRRVFFGQRGSAAVEGAIVTPLVMALFFGVIELGFLFKDYLSVGAAVRSGVRIASASPRTTTFAQAAANKVKLAGDAMNFSDVKDLWVYKVDPLPPAGTGTNNPIGGSGFTSCTVCVKFRWDAGTKTFVVLSDNWPAMSQNACSSSSIGGPPDRIGIYLRLRHQAFTKFVFSSVDISEASIATLEPMPVSGGCK
jgi:Flp pilus assembly protein TadG